MIRHRLAPFLTAAIALVAGPLVASAQHADALLLIDPNGDLVTGTHDFDLAVTQTNVRVYEGEFDEFGTIDEPGFNAHSSSSGLIPPGFSSLPASKPVTFTGKSFTIDAQTSNLWFWNASGPVSFAPVSNGTLLNISKAPAINFSADFDGSASDVTGFTIDTTSATGLLHKHIDFSLIGSGNNLANVEEGFYLWSFTFTVDDKTTLPVYFVHGFGEHDEELHEQAIDFVQDNLVPEPASLALLAIGGLSLLLRRR